MQKHTKCLRLRQRVTRVEHKHAAGLGGRATAGGHEARHAHERAQRYAALYECLPLLG